MTKEKISVEKWDTSMVDNLVVLKDFQLVIQLGLTMVDLLVLLSAILKALMKADTMERTLAAE